jgi:copper(I)-binding protein
MRTLTIATALALGFGLTAHAADMVSVGDIMIHAPWARASVGNPPNSAAYMTLETMGAGPDRLVGGSSPVAKKVQLDTNIMENGIAKMRPVKSIEVAPEAPTVLEPGGLHVMLVGLTKKLEAGTTFPLTLEFEHAGKVTLDVPVKGTGQGSMDHGAMKHGDEGSSNLTDARSGSMAVAEATGAGDRPGAAADVSDQLKQAGRLHVDRRDRIALGERDVELGPGGRGDRGAGPGSKRDLPRLPAGIEV